MEALVSATHQQAGQQMYERLRAGVDDLDAQDNLIQHRWNCEAYVTTYSPDGRIVNFTGLQRVIGSLLDPSKMCAEGDDFEETVAAITLATREAAKREEAR